MNYSTIQCLIGGQCWRLTFQILQFDPTLSKYVIDYASLSDACSRCKNIVKLSSGSTADRIQINYRLIFMRDCIFDRTIDERMVRSLASMVNMNYIEIV